MRTITNTTTHPAKINELLSGGEAIEAIRNRIPFATVIFENGAATAVEYRSRPDQGKGHRALGIPSNVPVPTPAKGLNRHESAAYAAGSGHGIDGGIWD